VTNKLDTLGRERLLAVAAGDSADRPPISFWRHFYTEENDPRALADALLGFHRDFGWDWIKLNPRASYHLEDWGYRFEPSTDPLAKPVPKFHPVSTAADWSRIEPLDPKAGVLGEHLQAIRHVVAGAGGDPVLMTLFTPLSVAGDLVAADEVLLRHIHESPEAVKSALEAITQTFERFAAEVLNAGADGLFFATTQWASHARLTDAEYDVWGRPYDLRILAAASGARINLLHVCDRRNMLIHLADYPVQLLNWGFEDEGNLSLEAGVAHFDRGLVGGVSRKVDLLTSTPDEVYTKVADLKVRMAGYPWGCGPDCSIYPHSKVDNLRAVKAALDTPAS
jgi:uroporphyrinogen decarboxylase